MNMLSRMKVRNDQQDLSSPTWVTALHGKPQSLNVRRCRLEVVAGVDAGKVFELEQPTIVMGRVGADVTLTDAKVSGLHCELRLTSEGYRLRDLGSTNGTYVKGVRVVEAFIMPSTTIHIGKTGIVFEPLDESVPLPLWNESRLHQLIGGSPPMRHLFEMIHRFAQSDATVLIEAETGSGKELVADAIHESSPRRRKPFVVLDCSAIPEQLFEAQLFGHEVGAFTGAVKATPGVFELAHGGTLFLDEIGELPILVQAKLLRAVETRRVRRLGGTKMFASDVRIVAATNRDLASEVNRGTFRSDLYYRLAVAKLRIPPLRERRDDIPALVELFMRQLSISSGDPDPKLPEDFLARAKRHSWPGNVRELRNAVERAVLVPNHPELNAETMTDGRGDAVTLAIDTAVPFKKAKQRWIDEFDRRYLTALLEMHGGNISAVSRAAGIERVSIYNIIRRLGLNKGNESPGEESLDDEDCSDPTDSER